MSTSLRKALHALLTWVLGLAFLLCIGVPFTPSDSDAAELLLMLAGSGFVMGIFLLMTFCCLLPIDKPGLKGFSIIGTSVCMLSMMYLLYRIWFFDKQSFMYSGYRGWMAEAKFFGAINVFALAFAQAGVLLRLNVRTKAVGVARIVTICAIAFVALVLLIMMFTESFGGEVLLRATLLASIVSFFGTIGTLYLHEASRREAHYEIAGEPIFPSGEHPTTETDSEL